MMYKLAGCLVRCQIAFLVEDGGQGMEAHKPAQARHKDAIRYVSKLKRMCDICVEPGHISMQWWRWGMLASEECCIQKST